MITRTIIIILSFIFLGGCAAAAAPQLSSAEIEALSGASLEELGPTIDELAVAYVEATGGLFGGDPKVVGMVVGIVRGDGRWVRGYGRVDHESDAVPSGETVFEIGSISKTFAGGLLAESVRRGEIELDSAVCGLLPEHLRRRACKEPSITALDLATHTSGLPRLPSNLDPKDLDDPYADFDVDDMYRYVVKRGLKRREGERHLYSNLGFGILGQTLVLASDAPSYEDLLRERILDPLNMHDTRISWREDELARRASSYRAWGKRGRNWTFDALAPAGAIHSTVDDMLLWIEANLGRGSEGLVESLRESHEPQRRIADEVQIGLAWMSIAHPELDETLLIHDGETGGYHGLLALLPESDAGVIILANTTFPIEPMSFEIVKLLAAGSSQP